MLFILILFQLPLVCEESYQIIEDKAHTPIFTPSFANRQTAKIQLSNGLDAYLISDPKATKSAAALVVDAGSWQDPAEYPGLAHFLEHMLFLGTEKYPTESEYDRFIKEHDGQSNAYTASTHTVYFFSINHDAFPEALDRFAFFFKKPLFNPSGVDRELQAIDQEFAKNFTDDDVREHYVLKELSNPQHPFHRFSAGNSSTLSHVSQKALKQWYHDHYSANLMHLIVYSSLPLDTLRDLVIQDFNEVPNTNRPPFHLHVPLFSTLAKGKMVYITPLKDIRTLDLMWELPSTFAHMNETRPELVVCSLLGHEGPESLLSLLKKQNLAEGLNCAGHKLGDDNVLFSLTINLTEEGLNQVNLVIEECFEAIATLKEKGLPAYIFDEIKKMGLIRYQYQQQEDPFDYVMKLGEWRSNESLETFPEQSTMIQSFDPKAIKDLLNVLTPADALMIILAKPQATGLAPDQKEHWMGVPYTIRPLSPQQLDQWSQVLPNPQLRIPPPNPFIPKQIDLIKPTYSVVDQSPFPHPEILLEEESAKIYYALDEVFRIPKTFWSFNIKTPFVERGDPQKVVLADLYIKCLEEALKSYTYSAELADLNYEIQRFENGINITISGYSNNAEFLFNAILNRLRTCHPTEKLFAIFKDSLLRQYQNFAEEGALLQGLEMYQSLIYANFSTQSQLASAIETITYSHLLDYITHLFDQTYTTGLLYGHLTKQQALPLWEKLRHTLRSRPYPIAEQIPPKVISLPANQGPFFLDMPIKSPGNAVILGIEDGGFSFQTRAAQQIIMQAMNGPFYSTLRTKQQTGYLVYTRADEIEKHLFSLFAVQSNTHDPRDLLARFELFIESFLQEMAKADLTPERFEVIRQSLLTTLEQPPQSLVEMGKLLKNLAFKYEGDFDWMAKRISGFKDLTYENFLEIASQSLGKTNKRRLAVLVYGTSTENKGFKYTRLLDKEEIRKLSEYTHIKSD